jgi:hypothetical protein
MRLVLPLLPQPLLQAKRQLTPLLGAAALRKQQDAIIRVAAVTCKVTSALHRTISIVKGATRAAVNANAAAAAVNAIANAIAWGQRSRHGGDQ